MSKNSKGRTGWRQTTPNVTHTHNYTARAPRPKAVIVKLAVWDLLPIELAERFIDPCCKGGPQ